MQYSTDAIDNPRLAALLGRLSGVRPSGAGWAARCPAHEDRRSSLSIALGDGGRVLLYCHVGCSAEAVVEAVGLSMRDLMPPTERNGRRASKGRPANGKPIERNGKPRGRGRAFLTMVQAQAVLSLGIEGNGAKALPSHTWTYLTAAGEPAGAVLRWDTPLGKEIRPLAFRDGCWFLGAMASPRPLFNLPALAEADLVLLVEGEKCCDAAARLGFHSTTWPGGAAAAHLADFGPLAGKHVALLPDADEAGRRAMEAAGRALLALDPPAHVAWLDLPGLGPGEDIADWAAAREAIKPPAVRNELRHLLATAKPWEPPPESSAADDRQRPGPEIRIGPDERRIVDEAIVALAHDQGLYQRAGALVHVVRDAAPAKLRVSGSGPRIAAVEMPNLRERLAEVATWRRGGDEPKPVHPPDWVVKAVAARRQWPGVRPLEGVIESPTLRADGSVLQTPGYDEPSGLVYSPSTEYPPIAERPTRDDALRARDALLEIVVDFPLATETHRAAWLAAALTPFARAAIDGPAPMMLIDGNVRGCGKTLLADAISVLATGRPAPRMTCPSDDDEMRKIIVSVALAGYRLVLLDNVAGALGSPSLDAALTGNEFQGRLLGTNDVATLRLSMTWVSTANNVVLSGDLVRRVLPIRLESREETPEERTGFQHPELLTWLAGERPRMVAAALTILRAYFLTDNKPASLTPWGSFEAWSRLVRGAVTWLGMPDPAAGRVELESADRDSEVLWRLLAAWESLDPQRLGLTAAEAMRAVEARSADAALLGDLLAEAMGPSVDARVLGKSLRRLRRRVAGGRWLDSRPGRNSQVWFVGDKG